MSEQTGFKPTFYELNEVAVFEPIPGITMQAIRGGEMMGN